MVVTDDERRAAARKLRGYVDMPDGWWQETLPQFYIEKCIFGDLTRHGEDELFARLADLIEPSEPKVKCVAEVKVDGERLESLVHDAAVELTGIDCDALLALAEAMDGHARDVSAGRNYVDSRDLNGYARRIRETLGGVPGNAWGNLHS